MSPTSHFHWLSLLLRSLMWCDEDTQRHTQSPLVPLNVLYLSCHTHNLPGSLKSRENNKITYKKSLVHSGSKSLSPVGKVKQLFTCWGEHTAPAFRISDLLFCMPCMWSAWDWAKRQPPHIILGLQVCEYPDSTISKVLTVGKGCGILSQIKKIRMEMMAEWA